MKYKFELDFWPGNDVIGRIQKHIQNVVSAAKAAVVNAEPSIALVYALEGTGKIEISVHWWSSSSDISASITVDHDGNADSTEVVFKLKNAPEVKTIPY